VVERVETEADVVPLADDTVAIDEAADCELVVTVLDNVETVPESEPTLELIVSILLAALDELLVTVVEVDPIDELKEEEAV